MRILDDEEDIVYRVVWRYKNERHPHPWETYAVGSKQACIALLKECRKDPELADDHGMEFGLLRVTTKWELLDV